MGHFDYLMRDDERDFFQGVAEEQAVAEMPKTAAPVALEVVKVAEAEPQTIFEKIAFRLDQDIEIIKMAGPRGEGMGATERALNYMSRLEHDPRVTDEQFVVVFDKVAIASLDADLAEARANLRLITPPEKYDELDAELGKFANEAIEGFMNEWGDYFPKEAVIAGLAGRVGRGLLSGPAGARALGRSAGRAARKAGPAAMRAGDKAFTGAGKKIRGAVSGTKKPGALRRGVATVKSVPAGMRASWRKLVKTRTARNLSGAKTNRAQLLKAYEQAGARGNVAQQGMLATQIRGANKQVSKLSKKRGAQAGRLQEATTLRGTAKGGKTRGAGAAKAEAAKGQATAKAQAAEAAKTPKPSKATTPSQGKKQGITRKEQERRQAQKGERRPAAASARKKKKVDTSSPAAAQATMSKAKNEGWWASLSDQEKKNVALAAGGGLLAGQVLD